MESPAQTLVRPLEHHGLEDSLREILAAIEISKRQGHKEARLALLVGLVAVPLQRACSERCFEPTTSTTSPTLKLGFVEIVVAPERNWTAVTRIFNPAAEGLGEREFGGKARSGCGGVAHA